MVKIDCHKTRPGDTRLMDLSFAVGMIQRKRVKVKKSVYSLRNVQHLLRLA